MDRLEIEDAGSVGDLELIESIRLLASWAVRAHRRCTAEPPVDNARETGNRCAPVAESPADNSLDDLTHSANMSLLDMGLHDSNPDEEP